MWINEQAVAMDSTLQWLISQCEDQMVRGWLIYQRDWLRSMSYSGIPKFNGSWQPNLPKNIVTEEESHE